MPSDMSPERRAEIAERCARATKPPWNAEITGPHDNPDYAITQTSHVTRDVWHIPHVLDDVPFIAHARQDVEDLLAALDAAEARMKQLETACNADCKDAIRYALAAPAAPAAEKANGGERC